MSDLTAGGSEVFHHREPSDQNREQPYDEGLRDAITAHLAPFVPGEPTVLGEIVSGDLPLDVLVWTPTGDRPLWTLVSCGMSAFALPTPPGAEEWSRCELIMTLPPDWPMPSATRPLQEIFADQANYWPIQALKEAARLPHSYNTWLSIGHTLTTGEDPDDIYEASPYSGLMLSYPTSLQPEALRAEYAGHQIYFWGLYPLYPIEMEFKLAMGADALFDRFAEEGLHEGVHPDRPPLVEKEMVEEDPPTKGGLLGRLFGTK